MTKINLICAVSYNNVIAYKDDCLPWKLKKDFSWFKRITSNSCILMGRKTFESPGLGGKPLPYRKNVILTRDPNYTVDHKNVFVFNDPDEALKFCINESGDDVYIIGGSEIWNLYEDKYDRLLITIVDTSVDEESIKFDPFSINTTCLYNLVKSETFEKNSDNNHSFAIHIYSRDGIECSREIDILNSILEFSDYGNATKLGCTDKDRWNQGIGHHKNSLRLMEFLQKHDSKDYSDYFDWSTGGDGDNGETLMFQLDAFFEYLDLTGEKI